MKEIAYSEIASSLDTTVASIKTKLNSLRTQLGKELAKERNTKSGQATDELYVSSWVFYQNLAFLIPVFGNSKSRDTLKRISLPEDDSGQEANGSTPQSKKKTIAEKKLDLLSKCTDAITANAKKNTPEEKSSKANMSAFAVYVDEKMSQLDRRGRRIAEKRISDVLFDIEMSADVSQESSRPLPFGYSISSMQQQQPMPVTPQAIGIHRQAPTVISQHGNYAELQSQPGQSYMDMMKQ